jgi:hypothetical protein
MATHTNDNNNFNKNQLNHEINPVMTIVGTVHPSAETENDRNTFGGGVSMDQVNSLQATPMLFFKAKVSYESTVNSQPGLLHINHFQSQNMGTVTAARHFSKEWNMSNVEWSSYLVVKGST